MCSMASNCSLGRGLSSSPTLTYHDITPQPVIFPATGSPVRTMNCQRRRSDGPRLEGGCSCKA